MRDGPRTQLAKNAMRNPKAKNATESCLVDTDLGGQVPKRDFSVYWNLLGNIEAGNKLEVDQLVVLHRRSA